MFDVPLEAYLQEQSPPDRLGATLASTNLLVFTGMLASSLGYYVLRMPVGAEELAKPLFSARGVFLIFALLAGQKLLLPASMLEEILATSKKKEGREN